MTTSPETAAEARPSTPVGAEMWRPAANDIGASNITRFMQFLSERGATDASDYPALYEWSIAEPESFWSALWDFCEIKATKKGDRVAEHLDRTPGATWFPDAKLNFAANLLRYRDGEPAIIFRNERGDESTITYAQLYTEVARLAAALQQAGIDEGDRVAGFMPNLPQAIIAMLAAASLGAVWSSCSPDFGLQGVLDRFGQIEPKILFAADGYFYNGKHIDTMPRLKQIVDGLPSIKTTVVVPYTRRTEAIDLASIRGGVPFDVFQRHGAAARDIFFEPLPFQHPLYIMYSSGTTGVPKCIVHGAGGTLIQHLKELVLHTDLRREDRIFYFTTCGWMMWNWLVSSLAVGATVMLYDGSPTHPSPDTLWRFAADAGITVFGTSAKYLSAIEKFGVKPGASYDLKALRAILSTGSPLAPESFDYVYHDIKKDLLLASISGGTDIVSCFALGCPVLPVHCGELQCRGLGMKVEIRDDAGKPVRGEKGELCCSAPFPSMPIHFWNDPEGERYRASYFERFEGVWCHGDYAELTEHDGLIIYGRSDAVLNPGGVRIGTAEIYRIVETLPQIVEAIAVGQEWQDDTRVILFVIMKEGTPLDDALSREIKTKLRAEASPRHVPAKILAVPEIPRTISGKIVELAVANVIHGRPVKNTDALANPKALEHFRDLAELAKP